MTQIAVRSIGYGVRTVADLASPEEAAIMLGIQPRGDLTCLHSISFLKLIFKKFVTP
jgi:hypothetical protein